MPKYLVSSEGPIHVRQIERPDMPDWRPETGLPGVPDTGGPGRPPWADWERPTLPPREEWPPLPPIPGLPDDWRERLEDYLGSLTPEHPWVPVPPGPGIDPPPVWPPTLPDLPDFSGKTLVLARFYVSRHVNYLRWVLIDHEDAKAKIKDALDKIKDHLPAGGVGGTPPARPQPGAPTTHR